MDDGAGMTPSEFASVTDRRKWLVSSAVPVFVAAAAVPAVIQTPMYASSSEVLVQARGRDWLFGDDMMEVNDRSIETEIQIIEAEKIRQRVRSDSDLDEMPSRVAAAAVGETKVVSLVVRDPGAASVEPTTIRTVAVDR